MSQPTAKAAQVSSIQSYEPLHQPRCSRRKIHATRIGKSSRRPSSSPGANTAFRIVTLPPGAHLCAAPRLVPSGGVWGIVLAAAGGVGHPAPSVSCPAHITSSGEVR